MTREEKHKKHGCPFPTGHSVDVVTKTKAIAIAADHKKLLIQYIYKRPRLFKDLTNRDALNYKPAYKVSRGSIVGVLVAFKDGHKLLVGWSQRHSTNEALSFNKTDARECAVTRGLLDSILIESKEKMFTSIPKRTPNRNTLDPQHVPSPLKYYLPSFVSRVLRYFKAGKIDNVCDAREVVNAESGKA